MSTSVAIIDYGMGNLHSISKAVQKVGGDVQVTNDAKRIAAADRVVLPGVGAIRDTMHELQRRDLIDPVRQAMTDKPFLGVCLGMQALLDHSDENDGVDCLGVVPGNVRHFASESATDGLKIPHMGWNTVEQPMAHALWEGIADGSRFYFVHSYFVQPADEAVVAGATPYGIRFCAALARDNLFAAQFHPEKSHTAGLKLLENFLSWNP